MAMGNALGLRVEKISPLCQLQDLGRFGYQRFGVTRSGAMDPLSLRLANILVGNPEHIACLEFSLLGGEFTVTAEHLTIAFVGGFPLRINGEIQPPDSNHHLRQGDRLAIGNASTKNGIRGYLAVAGGFITTPVLGSCATHQRSAMGGFTPAAESGNCLPVELPVNVTTGKQIPKVQLASHQRRPLKNTLRVVAGPQQDHFTSAAIRDFYTKPFTLSADSDRMGILLTGNPLGHAGDGNIISDPVVPGSIQVPASGNPIVLMADGPTTGGYPKIATLCSVDCAVLAQLAPGSEVRFAEITVQEAQQLVQQQERHIKRLVAHCR